MKTGMLRNLVFVVASAAALILSTVAFAQTAQYGTAEEARVMLEKAVAAVKADKTKALDIFSEGGFKDRDLYVFCANASDSVQTARCKDQRLSARSHSAAPVILPPAISAMPR